MLRQTAFDSNAAPPPYSPGAIVPDALYPLDLAAARLGWGHDAVLAARKNGLPVHRSGRRNFVLGSDLFMFITSEPITKTPARSRRPAAKAKPRRR